MLRISKEIRIFSLVGFNGKKSLFVDKVMENYLHNRVRVEILKVSYEFMCGGNEIIKITK